VSGKPDNDTSHHRSCACRHEPPTQTTQLSDGLGGCQQAHQVAPPCCIVANASYLLYDANPGRLCPLLPSTSAAVRQPQPTPPQASHWRSMCTPVCWWAVSPTDVPSVLSKLLRPNVHPSQTPITCKLEQVKRARLRGGGLLALGEVLPLRN
jgi:hypothetical protein